MCCIVIIKVHYTLVLILYLLNERSSLRSIVVWLKRSYHLVSRSYQPLPPANRIEDLFTMALAPQPFFHLIAKLRLMDIYQSSTCGRVLHCWNGNDGYIVYYSFSVIAGTTYQPLVIEGFIPRSIDNFVSFSPWIFFFGL